MFNTNADFKMIKLISTIFIIVSFLAQSYAQEKVLLIGFPEKNFKSESKSIEKLAKKNSTTTSQVDDLYRRKLLEAMANSNEEFEFVLSDENEFELISKYIYDSLLFKKQKYFGISNEMRELNILFSKYNIDFIALVTQYHMYTTIGLNLRPKIVHKIDYQIINKNLETTSAGFFKMTGFYQTFYKPKDMEHNYYRLGKKLQKRLFIDLAEKQGFYRKICSDVMYASRSNHISFSILNYEYNPKHGIGFIGGWGAPYGFGLEYSYLVTNNLDLNAGLGFSFSGLRTGIGTRYFFKDQGSSPFAGANFIYTSGLSGLEVSTSDGTGKYKVESDQALFIRGGYKIEHYNKLFFINLGYGIPFDHQNAIWQSGEESSTQQDFANLMRLGGVEVSGSIVFRIGK